MDVWEEDDADEVETVGELIEKLSRFALETPIAATWEGVFERIAVLKELRSGHVIIVADEVGEGRLYLPPESR